MGNIVLKRRKPKIIYLSKRKDDLQRNGLKEKMLSPFYTTSAA